MEVPSNWFLPFASYWRRAALGSRRMSRDA